MGWIGRIVGGTIGALIGGPIGAALGFGMGYVYDDEQEFKKTQSAILGHNITKNCGNEKKSNTNAKFYEVIPGEKYITKITGVSFYDRQSTISMLDITDKIYLQRDRTNVYDPNAIGVFTLRDNKQIGWVPKELASKLAPEIDKGIPYSAKIVDILGGGPGRHYGVKIRVERGKPISMQTLEVNRLEPGVKFYEVKPDKYISKVTGTLFDRRQAIISRLSKSDRIHLRLDGANYNSNTIGVFTLSNERIGWIPKELAEKIAPEMKKGAKYKASIIEITREGKTGKYYGVKIRIEKDTEKESTWRNTSSLVSTGVGHNITKNCGNEKKPNTNAKFYEVIPGEKYITKITGVSFYDRQSTISMLDITDKIYLQRDRTNVYDPNAIGVFTLRDNKQIGWVPKELASKLAPEIDKGIPYSAKIVDILGGGPGRHYGVKIRVERGKPISMQTLEVNRLEPGVKFYEVKPDKYISKVTGTLFDRRQAIISRLSKSDRIHLRLDGANYNSNTIGVFTLSNERIGWIPKELAEKIAPEMKKGAKYKASIIEITREGKTGKYYGVKIRIEKDAEKESTWRNTSSLVSTGTATTRMSSYRYYYDDYYYDDIDFDCPLSEDDYDYDAAYYYHDMNSELEDNIDWDSIDYE
ncbi:MAG: hypothetical protein H0Z24_09940 [Thermosipho sp. (in: Bacteria)]|nr:hypothetical protein [Thermosipho sp. (in: thermotogales)]